MTEDAVDGAVGSGGRASEKYEIVVKRAPFPEHVLRWFGSLVIAATAQGDSSVIPGGQRIEIKDLASGETVADFKQGFGDDFDVAGDLMGQLMRLSIDDFERACGITSS